MKIACTLKLVRIKAIWLTLLLPFIGGLHALCFFWLYGRRVDFEGLLVGSWCGALLLYVSALHCSTLFKINSLKGVKVALLSLPLSLMSSYVGAFLAFN